MFHTSLRLQQPVHCGSVLWSRMKKEQLSSTCYWMAERKNKISRTKPWLLKLSMTKQIHMAKTDVRIVERYNPLKEVRRTWEQLHNLPQCCIVGSSPRCLHPFSIQVTISHAINNISELREWDVRKWDISALPTTSLQALNITWELLETFLARRQWILGFANSQNSTLTCSLENEQILLIDPHYLFLKDNYW